MYNNNGFIKGMMAGLVVGATVSAITSNKQVQHMSHRMMRKSRGKAMRTVGEIIDRITR